MRWRGVLFFIAAMVILGMVPNEAAERTWDVSGGIVDTDFDTGFNLAFGLNAETRALRVTLNFIDLNVFSAEADGFRRETLPGGTEICRDQSNGQFADRERCEDNEFDFAVSSALGYLFRKPKYPLFLAIGARVGGDDDLGGDDLVYGQLQVFSKKKRFYWKFMVSGDYKQLSGGLVF